MKDVGLGVQCVIACLLLLSTEFVLAERLHVRQGRVEKTINTDDGSWRNWLSSFTRRLTSSGPQDDPLRNEQDIFDTGTGAEVFKITFSDKDVGLAQNGSVDVLKNLNISRVTELRGVNGNPRNRYIWSMALDDKDDLYVGVFNAQYHPLNYTSLLWSVVTAPFGKKFDALVDMLLRQWSGSPIFSSEGAQIYYKPKESPSFQLQLQTTQDFDGFRNMINYRGSIYAGSTNGPEGPYDGKPYDFSFYQEGMGAKIFTNAGNGSFYILDDQGNLDSYDKAIRGMAVSSYSNRLFIGTETYECAKVLVYNDSPLVDGSARWKQIKLEGDDCTHSVSDLYDLGDGKILVGTWETLGYGVYLLDEKDNDKLTKLNTPNYFAHVSCGIMEIRLFKGHLYLGILSYVRGFALIRTAKYQDLLNLDGRRDWELITGNGFARQQRQQLGGNVAGNEYPWSSAEINGIYFIGTVSLFPRGFSWQSGFAKADQAQLWASLDGTNWQIVESELFDESPFMYGFRTMEVTKDNRTLYIGSAVNMYLL